MTVVRAGEKSFSVTALKIRGFLSGLILNTHNTHFSELPKQEVGQQVRMGEVLGPTGNSGIDVKTRKQSERRRTAVHFGVFYNTSGDYAVPKGKMVIPVGGKWMDPNAMFRKNPPYDSASLKELHEDAKNISISIMFEDGITIPAIPERSSMGQGESTLCGSQRPDRGALPRTGAHCGLAGLSGASSLF